MQSSDSIQFTESAQGGPGCHEAQKLDKKGEAGLNSGGHQPTTTLELYWYLQLQGNGDVYLHICTVVHVSMFGTPLLFLGVGTGEVCQY